MTAESEADSQRGSLEIPGLASRQEGWRVFCAIELLASVRASLMSHINRLRELAPDAQASWSRAESIHLTMKFLGEIPTSLLSQLSDAAARTAADFSPFQITIEETGVFPKHGTPRVLWIGVKDESGKLAEFHTRLEDACAEQGFAREDRAFHPHLTLARLRKPQGGRDLASAHKALQFEPAEVAVTELLVIRSQLSNAGSKYTVISRHMLES